MHGSIEKATALTREEDDYRQVNFQAGEEGSRCHRGPPNYKVRTCGLILGGLARIFSVPLRAGITWSES